MVGIMPTNIFKKGHTGVISRSGTLTYQVVAALTAEGLGQSSAIGVGGDPIVGLYFQELLEMFQNDPETDSIAIIGEIGGDAEERAAEYIKQYVDEIITVSDYELMEAFLLLVEKHKLVAENSGILPLAGLRKLNCTGKKVVAIVSGGNIDVLTISSMINKGLVVRGRIFTFSVNLPDKPGQLVAVSQMLAEADANVIKLDHNQFKNLDRFHEVELQVTVETNGEEHIQQIIDTFKNNGYIIKRLNSSETLSE